jgi:hypothetical protein
MGPPLPLLILCKGTTCKSAHKILIALFGSKGRGKILGQGLGVDWSQGRALRAVANEILPLAVGRGFGVLERLDVNKRNSPNER